MFKKNLEKHLLSTQYLDTLPLPILNEIKSLLCEGALTKKELNAAVVSVAQEKKLGTNGMTKELLSCFWEELKEPFVTSIKATKSKIENFISKTSCYQINVEKRSREDLLKTGVRFLT